MVHQVVGAPVPVDVIFATEVSTLVDRYASSLYDGTHAIAHGAFKRRAVQVERAYLDMAEVVKLLRALVELGHAANFQIAVFQHRQRADAGISGELP